MMAIRFIRKARLVSAYALFLAALAGGQESSPNASSSRSEPLSHVSQSTKAGKTNPITDLVLIYDGGEVRIPWTADQFRPYVYREEAGKIEWLYDGFLFLDPLAKSGNRLSPITNRKDATKGDWQDLLDHFF